MKTIMSKTKVCKTCGKRKSIDMFHIHSGKKDGLRSYARGVSENIVAVEYANRLIIEGIITDEEAAIVEHEALEENGFRFVTMYPRESDLYLVNSDAGNNQLNVVSKNKH